MRLTVRKKVLTKGAESGNISFVERHAPVAQLDRVPGYEPVGRGFESLQACQKENSPSGEFFFCVYSGIRTGRVSGNDPGDRFPAP